MIDRAAIIEELKAALKYDQAYGDSRRTFSACRDHFEEIIRALAAVRPAPTATDHTPVGRLRAVLETQASPTIDRGDSHGARGQKGWIVYESSLALVAAAFADPSIPEREKIV